MGHFLLRSSVEKKYHRSDNIKNVVFIQVLTELAEGGRSKGGIVVGGSFHPDLVQEFNPNIQLDNLKHDESHGGRRASSNSPSHINSPSHSIQLAAKMVSFFSNSACNICPQLSHIQQWRWSRQNLLFPIPSLVSLTTIVPLIRPGLFATTMLFRALAVVKQFVMLQNQCANCLQV